ncbi:MAG: SPFH domain-containing protein [Oscillospiraceae bacterium]|jgi:membrane protease subunit (stomatin/prohibitin family)|nr:SPFH domain-containing protein [Oscillospiraceae bacterium]
MGIIRAAVSSLGGSLADQWQEVIKADAMSDTTVMASGVAVRPNDKRNQNKKGTKGVISNGSVIMVEQNQFMMLTDGGKIIDYSAEPGYYTVDGASAPSLFNGEFDKVIEHTFERLKFGGVTPRSQSVYYINTQEIKNIPFGTVNPINYFDNFYNAELYLRCHGYFSIRIQDPLKFFAEAIPRNAEKVDIQDIHKLYLSEFLTALQTSIGRMSVDGIRISHVTSKSMELAQYLSTALDTDWTQRRGMAIESVGISSISYDEQSKKLIDMRNQGAMLSDPGVREGYVQGSVARGIEAAGSNKGGAMGGFMGVNMGMNTAGGFMAGASASNQAQMEREKEANADTWQCSCGARNRGKFCAECGKPQPAAARPWVCAKCGAQNTGKFCAECGAKNAETLCPACGKQVSDSAKFCPECGGKL